MIAAITNLQMTRLDKSFHPCPTHLLATLPASPSGQLDPLSPEKNSLHFCEVKTKIMGRTKRGLSTDETSIECAWSVHTPGCVTSVICVLRDGYMHWNTAHTTDLWLEENIHPRIEVYLETDFV